MCVHRFFCSRFFRTLPFSPFFDFLTPVFSCFRSFRTLFVSGRRRPFFGMRVHRFFVPDFSAPYLFPVFDGAVCVSVCLCVCFSIGVLIFAKALQRRHVITLCYFSLCSLFVLLLFFNGYSDNLSRIGLRRTFMFYYYRADVKLFRDCRQNGIVFPDGRFGIRSISGE